MILLHDYWRSSASYRVRIALNLKGLAYERVKVDLAAGGQRGEEYRALNPQGFVPMLEIDGLRLTQSLAIIDYLDARQPEPRLLPADSARRARVLAMALTVACDIHPVNNLRILQYLKRELGHEQPAIDQWICHWIAEGFAALETLATESDGPFLSGDEPGLADICLIPQIYNARRFALSLADFPRLAVIDAAARTIPAFADAHPDNC